MSGRPEPARTEPSVLITRRSVSQFGRELREVVVEGKMDDGVGTRGAVLEAVRIVDGPAIDFGAGGGERRRLSIRSERRR